jgi:hypothetical protein
LLTEVLPHDAAIGHLVDDDPDSAGPVDLVLEPRFTGRDHALRVHCDLSATLLREQLGPELARVSHSLVEMVQTTYATGIVPEEPFADLFPRGAPIGSPLDPRRHHKLTDMADLRLLGYPAVRAFMDSTSDGPDIAVVATEVRTEAVAVVRGHRLAAAGGGPLVIDPSRHISPTQKPIELTDTRTGTRRAAVRIRSFHDDDVPLEVLPVPGTAVLLAAADTVLPTDRWTPLPAQTGDPVERVLEQHLRLPADDKEN